MTLSKKEKAYLIIGGIAATAYIAGAISNGARPAQAAGQVLSIVAGAAQGYSELLAIRST